MFTYRFRDSSASWEGQGNEKNKSRFTPTNICDFMAHNYFKGETLLLELKSTQAKSASFTNIKKNQIIGLYNAGQFKGTRCFFIFNFRSVEETYAIEAGLVKKYMDSTDKKSFSIEWVRQNGIRILQQKIRTRYKYKVENLLN